MSKTERRAFLKLMIGSAVTGTVLKISPVNAEVSDQLAEVILKAKEIAALSNRYQNAKIPKLEMEITEKIDILLGMMVTVFNNKMTITDIDHIINEKCSVLKNENFSKLNTKMIPISIMRELIHDYRIPLKIGNSPNFEIWAKSFQPAHAI